MDVTKLVLAIFLVCCVMVFREFIKRHGLHRVLVRLGTGHHLDGSHRTNRGYLVRGTRPASGGVHQRHHWLDRTPRAVRAAAFWAVVFGVPFYLIGASTAPAVTVLALRCVMAATGLVLGLAGLRQLLRRHHRKHVVRPAAIAMASHLGLSAPAVMSQLKIMPRAQNAQPGQIVARIKALPDHYVASQGDQDWVEQFLTTRIPCSLTFSWRLDKHPMSLVVRCASAPPRKALLAAWADYMRSLPRGQYLTGIGINDEPKVWKVREEDPHAAVQGHTRSGKTNENLSFAAQALQRGESVTCVDPKRVSMRCLEGVPGFTLANDPRNVQEMWDAISGVRQRMDDAIDRGDESGDETLILEEINAMFPLFRAYWMAIKTPQDLITAAPPWEDVRAILFQGAQFGYRVIVDGQDLNAQALFGARSLFGTVLLSSWKPKQWAYIVGTTPVPVSTGRKGRFCLVQGGKQTFVQAILADDRGGRANEEAWRQFALSGREEESPWTYSPPPWRAWFTRTGKPRKVREEISGPPGQREIPRVLLGHRAAADYAGMSYGTFMRRRGEHPVPGEFEDTVGGRKTACYTTGTLDLWRTELDE